MSLGTRRFYVGQFVSTRTPPTGTCARQATRRRVVEDEDRGRADSCEA